MSTSPLFPGPLSSFAYDTPAAKAPQAGDKLKNGAVVIDCANEVVIAAVRPGDRCPEFATWAIHYETGETYWGHYFGNIVDATKDFAKRAGLK
jgi:hypothetical protein